MRHAAWAAPITLFIAACGSRSPTSSTWVRVAPPEAVARWACRDELELRAAEAPFALVSAAARRASATRGPNLSTRVESGDRTYEVHPVASGDGSSVWEVRGVGLPAIVVGVDVESLLPPSIRPDGAGAFLITWQELRAPTRFEGTRRAIVLDARAIVLALPAEEWRDAWLVRGADGWILGAETVSRGLVVYDLDADGAVERETPIGWSTSARPLRAEGHGTLALAFHSERGIELISADGAAATVLAEPELRGAAITLQEVVPSDDGWWLVLTASWRDFHFSYAPSQTWFFRLSRDGSILAHGRSRAEDQGGLVVQTVRADGNRLLVSHTTETGTGYLQVVPRGPCEPPPLGPCDERRWGRTGPTSLARPPFDEAYDSSTQAASILARDAATGTERWRTTLGTSIMVAGTTGVEDRVHALLLGLRSDDFPEASEDAVVVTLDEATGSIRSRRTLAAHGARAGCIAARSERVVSGVATRDGLAVFEGDRLLWQSAGSWSGCRLDLARDRVLIAAERVRVETSGGPISEVIVHVVADDGRLLTAHRTMRTSRVDNLSVDADGAWLTWIDATGWHWALWRFDAAGDPIGDPHHLATLYFFPVTRIAVTELGPSLLWSDDVEQGIVPLCGAQRPVRSSGFAGMSLTVHPSDE